MQWWAAPGVDLHLITHAESIDGGARRWPATRRASPSCTASPGPSSSSRATPPRPAGCSSCRAEGKIVLVSGGGWGVGDLSTSIDAALGLDVALVVALCGRNEELRARLEADFVSNARVRVVGFTEHMNEWLAAADVLVHSTGGLTVLEANMRGCPTISFGWGRGHVRVNNEAFRRFGLAQVARTRGRARVGAPALARGASRGRSLVRGAAVGRVAGARADLVRPPTAATWFVPAAAPVFRPLAAACHIPCRLEHERGVALTFDDGPHPEGTPAVLDAARPPRRRRHVLPRRRAGRAPARAGQAHRRGRARGRDPRLPPHAAAAAAHEGARRRPRPLRRDDRGRDRRRADPLPAALRRLQLGRARARARARLAPAALVDVGPRLAAAHERPPRSRGSRREAYAPATSCCCTTPTPTARRIPGGEPLRRCRRSSTRSSRSACPSVAITQST